VADDNRTIAAAIVASDLLIYFTPVTFGGYSAALKSMVDHQIQNILPFFAKVDGEVHHQKRYDRYPDFLAVGWLPAPDAQAEAVFKHLVRRNAINFYAPKTATAIVYAGQRDAEIQAVLQNSLNTLSRGARPEAPALPTIPTHGTDEPIRHALLLVGSPRTRASSSHALGGYVFEHLSARSIQVETIFLHTVLRSSEKMEALFSAVDAADLVLLAFPLYVDSLPAPVISALEQIAAHRAAQPSQHTALFSAIANCGFPEAAHNATALAICAQFARQAGFIWAGGLALGAGEGLVHGAPLTTAGGPAVPIKKALDLAAVALAAGEALPPAAAELLAKPVIPGWLYRLIGQYGWVQQAKKFGADKLIRRKTYA
jgi:NAD(P)H-dependent FMN reductase